jgi:hypothetical protein
LASFPQCRRPSRREKGEFSRRRKKMKGKETLAEREKPCSRKYHLAHFCWNILTLGPLVSSENYIFALHCVEPKMDRKLPKPTKFHNTAFQMFLEQDCDSSEGKNLLPPIQPSRRTDWFSEIKNLLLFSK